MNEEKKPIKVYALVTGYAGYDCIMLYSSRELAEKARCKMRPRKGWSIEEMEVYDDA